MMMCVKYLPALAGGRFGNEPVVGCAPLLPPQPDSEIDKHPSAAKTEARANKRCIICAISGDMRRFPCPPSVKSAHVEYGRTLVPHPVQRTTTACTPLRSDNGITMPARPAAIEGRREMRKRDGSLQRAIAY